MPFYEYKCDTCGHELEKFVKRMDTPDPDCPECEANEEVEAKPMGKKISESGFKLSGGGWAKDGYG